MSYLRIYRKNKNPKNLVFNDKIELIADEFDSCKTGNIIHSQPCNSIAGDWITKGYGWSKAGGDPRAYTLKVGIYKIKKSTYKKGPSISILRPETILGFKNFTLPHKIHRVNLKKDQVKYKAMSKDKKKYDISYSGGCVVLPVDIKYDILSACFACEDFNIVFPNHLKIIKVN